jgi:hypothetical protein
VPPDNPQSKALKPKSVDVGSDVPQKLVEEVDAVVAFNFK